MKGPFISIELMGGIGNVLFQIAAIEDMGRRTGIETYYHDIDGFMDYITKKSTWSTHYRELLTIFKNFNWHKNAEDSYEPSAVIKVPFEYTTIFPEPDTRYLGYFQSEAYFQDREFIINLFEPADHVKERVDELYKPFEGLQTCSIHVRRNNYLSLTNIYHVLGMDYYNKAMDWYKPYEIQKYLIFSDDIEWCKNNFISDQFVFIHDVDYIEMFTMARCVHHIIANSSFSWWGAYLGTHPNKFVVAPDKWFTSTKHNYKDIVPWHWVKV
jgi:hypothetical protein